MPSKIMNRELEIPGWGGLSLARFDEMFHDGEGRRSFKIEECREGDTMVIRAELPGIDPNKDVQVEMIDGELMITAQRTETHKTNSHRVHRSEFRYGSFTRSIPLPTGVDESKIEATYKDGVLEVRLPVPEQSPELTPPTFDLPGLTGPHGLEEPVGAGSREDRR